MSTDTPGMQAFQTEQEEFWAGEFGDDYTARNQGPGRVALNLAFFARIFAHTRDVSSAIEFGANLGLSLVAMQQLLPGLDVSGIEINPKAVEELKTLPGVKVYPTSILDFEPDYPRDFVLTKGTLIHINPDALPKVYDLLYRTSRRYICVAEYYNPTPTEVTYRGHTARLFKRDFAGELMDKYPDLQLLDYGFAYHRDPNFRQDDLTWFLLEKRPA